MEVLPLLSHSKGHSFHSFTRFIYGRLGYFMRNYFIVCYLVLGLISTVQAQTQSYTLINGIKVDAVAVSSARIASNGEVIQGIQFRAQSGTTPPKFYERAVQFNKGTTGASIKNFGKRNAGALGVVAATLAIGWVIDEITKDIYSLPAGAGATHPYPSTPTPIFSCAPSCPPNNSAVYGITAALVNSKIGGNSSSTNPNSSVNCNGTVSIATTYFHSNISRSTNLICSPSTKPAGWIETSAGTPAVIPSNTDTTDALLPKLAPSVLPKLHTNPDSGAIEKTQEVVNKATDVANEYARELNPSSVNATAPTAQPLPSTQEKPATDTLPSPSALSLPDFCTWASFLCDAPIEPTDSNWTVASMITEEEIELETYSSGLGSGSCPSPEAFTVYGTSISYSYQPMCDLAGVARIFVLIFAYLSSIYILLGIRK